MHLQFLVLPLLNSKTDTEASYVDDTRNMTSIWLLILTYSECQTVQSRHSGIQTTDDVRLLPL